ncbi:alpha/beta hydrolase [Streptomyces atroolivaceus]|uniref:alpha/beta hydrolase n=1 Tax=Streptomyces atroolivaceus TaxID=66869 RepID=UPI0024E12410|nr:alpha/beta hydrolase [Streptomyces atroolivaceus]
MARALGDGVGVLLTAEEEGHGTYPQNRCVMETADRYLRTGRPPGPGDGVPGQHGRRPVPIRRAAVSTPVCSQRPWVCTTRPPGPRPPSGGCRRGGRGRAAGRCTGGPRNRSGRPRPQRRESSAPPCPGRANPRSTRRDDTAVLAGAYGVSQRCG